MSTTFFISPFDPSLWMKTNPAHPPKSDLKIDPVEYRRVLLERWPSANEWISELFAGGVYWTLDEYGLRGIEIQLNKDLQHVTFSPYGINFIEFILWHREYVPAHYTLYLFNSSAWDSLLLYPEITKESISKFTGRGNEITKASPYNGTWDGILATEHKEKVFKYQITLHLSVYGERLEAECLIRMPKPGKGSIYTYLYGNHSKDYVIHLSRLNRTNSIGDGLPSEIEGFRSFKLDFEESDHPNLKGICTTQNDGVETAIGKVELKKR